MGGVICELSASIISQAHEARLRSAGAIGNIGNGLPLDGGSMEEMDHGFHREEFRMRMQ